jgi:hypothetical protein
MDHLDAMLHDQARLLHDQARLLHDQARLLAELEPLVPLIPRALALLDPGRAMRAITRRGGKNAFPKPAAAPLHVGEASEDRPPMGA